MALGVGTALCSAARNASFLHCTRPRALRFHSLSPTTSIGPGISRTLNCSRPQPLALRQARRTLKVRAESGNGATGRSGSYDFDLFTIGAGSGGVRASRFAATNYGAKVAVCELPYSYVSSDDAGGAGGTCVLRGCVPKKLLVYGGEFAEAFKDSVAFGWDAERPPVAWQRLQENKNKELDRLNGVYKKLLDGAKVTYIEGRGRVTGPHSVEVNGNTYTAKHILVATGGRAFMPRIEGTQHCITSDHALTLPAPPTKIAIIGGGYIALEFAGIFNHFGSEVHVLYRQPLPLRGFDQEVREFVTEQYRTAGLHLHPELSPQRIVKEADGSLTVHASSKEGRQEVMAGLSHVLMATGRKPNTRNMGLTEVGVDLNDRGAVVVDEYSQTTVPSIWAIGDVTDRIALTPVALMEGMALAKKIFGGDASSKPDYTAVASAVFSSPPIATVGLSEEEAAEKHGNVDVYTSAFKPMKNTISGNPTRSFMKVVVAANSGQVVGMHMVGSDCAEIMQGFAVAIKMGMTKAQLDNTIGIHPTAAEEFVTMRTVTRKLRVDKKAKAAAGRA